MYDQMYSTLTYNDITHHNPVTLYPAMKPYTIFVDGISKAFCATGVRVGWSLGPAPLIAKMKAILSHVGAWAPMAEQKATAKFLVETDAIEAFFVNYKQAIAHRLTSIYEGLQRLKAQGFAVDAIAPQAAIYLTVKMDLVGKTTPNGQLLTTQADVTDYLLANASLAIVPFYCFGADRNKPWYRMSVGTCRLVDIAPMLEKLEAALERLS